MTAIPTEPEQRDAWRRDPDAYEAVEALHRAREQLTAATDEQTIAIGLIFEARHEPMRVALTEKGKPMPTMDLVVEARERVALAEREWAAAVGRADELLIAGGV